MKTIFLTLFLYIAIPNAIANPQGKTEKKFLDNKKDSSGFVILNDKSSHNSKDTLFIKTTNIQDSNQGKIDPLTLFLSILGSVVGVAGFLFSIKVYFRSEEHKITDQKVADLQTKFSELQVEYSRLAINQNVYQTLFDYHLSERYRKASRFVNYELQNLYPLSEKKSISSIGRADETHANLIKDIAYFFDHIGMMVYFKHLDEDMIIIHFASSIFTTWKNLKPYIECDRIEREHIEKYTFLIHFEHLVYLATAEGKGEFDRVSNYIKNNDRPLFRDNGIRFI